MPFKSDKQRKYLEMLVHNKKRAKELGKSEKEMESIRGFVSDSEKEAQPKKERFSKLKKKMKG